MLLALGGTGLVGLGANSMWTAAFSSVRATRNSAVNTTADGDAYAGLNVFSPVTSGKRELLIEVANNLGDDANATVALEDGTQGTLYGPEGSQGSSVTFPLLSDSAKFVEIQASQGGVTIPFTIELNAPGATVRATRETYAENGNAKGAVSVKKVQNFAARSQQNEWTIKQVHIQANNYQLDRVEYEIRDAGGILVASTTHAADGGKYQRQNLSISPDDGHVVQSGESYTLRVTGYDTQGNFDSATRSATA